MLDVLRYAGYVFVAHLKRRIRVYALLVTTLLISVFLFSVSAPLFQTYPITITIKEGMSVREVGRYLEKENLIHSEIMFTVSNILFYQNEGVKTGVYVFEKETSLFTIAHLLAHGESMQTFRRVTIPEGLASYQITPLLEESLPHFNSEVFLTLAQEKEGMLFPETYFIDTHMTEEDIISMFVSEYHTSIDEVREIIDASGKTEREILIMASLLEREAKGMTDKQMVAGILYNRLSIDMPLQVDAVFGYILKRDTFHPSFSDLHIESPYNLYQVRGLPPGPINNPGLESIIAASTPIKSDYLYYLTGVDGNMYYAKTFEGHRENRRRFLDI